MTEDVFGTAALRGAVTEAWRGSPTRFREDANTEEDHAHGYYRGRVVVELAQNAADAAARAGEPGRLTLHLRRDPAGTWSLRAHNTGLPLDADGVASLASMRASAKTHPGQVGRFGVGFAAVRSVADEISVRSVGGGVRFSLEATREALEEASRGTAGGDVDDAGRRLAQAVAERGDALPVLRLPFPADGVTDGTVVELRLRDAAAVVEVRRQLAEVDDALLLALPALAEIVVSTDPEALAGGADDQGREHGPTTRRLADVGSRWTVLRAGGDLPPDVVASLPVELRRSAWTVVWALRSDDGRPRPLVAAPVLHGPTPTDEPLTFPALLVASFPLDPGRRHVAPGPVTDAVAQHAGLQFARLLADVASTGSDVLDLVPTGMPAGALDAAIRDAALAALRSTPLLAGADPGVDDPDVNPDLDDRAAGALVAPQDAQMLLGPAGRDPRVQQVLGRAVGDLVDVPARQHALARSLGVRARDLADLLDDVPAGLPPERWHEVYAALAPSVGEQGVAESLGAMVVPLADGRRVRGPRGTALLPEGSGGRLGELARALEVRVVDPAAAHPVLERLGAVPTSARRLLDDATVRAAVREAAQTLLDDPHDDLALEVTSAALELVALATGEAGASDDLPFWLGELPLATDEGDLLPARDCVLPGSWAADVFDALVPVAADVVDRWGQDVLRAVGVHTGLAVYRVVDVLVPLDGSSDAGDHDDLAGPGSDAGDGPQAWLASWSSYVAYLGETLGAGAWVGDVEAVSDLDAVADDAWPDLLARLAQDPAARAALVTPVRAEGGAGAHIRTAPSYTAWWLREHLGAPFAADVPLLAPVPPAVAGLDPIVRRALGEVADLGEVTPQDWPCVLAALPDVGSPVDPHVALAVWRGLAALAATGTELDPLPDRLPALHGQDVQVVDAGDVAVTSSTQHAQLAPVVPTTGDTDALADLLDLPVVPGEGHAERPDEPGVAVPLDPRVRALGPLPAHWFEHDDLTVGGQGVDWWVAGGEVHAATSAGLARALAEVCGRPGWRHLFAAALAEPGEAATLLPETVWDDRGGVSPAGTPPR
ncbi:sacsin N-terminal ATP-binding-like domain-containing protein [Oerskovia flava]|uniref:sacsin N-terminal ATP-binding-like domain-containing protein n=1 Tax=Oerskovia flava TaxID=2986422 RepID=UPI002240B3FC|nr:ATP-binding protein [Oerskovia sp. JB1-3-2]